tara:strand:+ start:553 stop:747 length:195 start_codon:yes stop_codon:yes gene_type:complete
MEQVKKIDIVEKDIKDILAILKELNSNRMKLLSLETEKIKLKKQRDLYEKKYNEIKALYEKTWY